MLPRLLLLLPLLCLFHPAYSLCKDGMDNVLELHDLFNGELNIQIEKVIALTYDKNMQPTCDTAKGNVTGRIELPGFIKFNSGLVRIKKGTVLVGSLQLLYSLEKNSYFVGGVCKNGSSVNTFVSNDFCSMDLLPLTGEKVWEQFMTAGDYDLKRLPAPWTQAFPIDLDSHQYVDGEWRVDLQLQMGKQVIAGVRFQQPEHWISVATNDRRVEL